jgi:hypothetical protein
LIIKDVTESIDKRMEEVRVELTVIDPEEAAAAAAAVKGGKKK